MELWPVLRGAVVAEKKIFTGRNCRVIVKPTFWNKDDPNAIKNGKHVVHSTQLLILSPSVTWNKLPVGGKVLTDEMTPVIDHYGWNEEYRTLAISHYTWEFGKKEGGGGEERPSSEVEILCSRHGEKITEHLLLSPTATKLAHRKQTQPVLRFVKWQQKLQANLFMPRVSKLEYFPRESGELTEDILVESIWIWAFNNSQARRKQFSLQNKP